MNRTLMAASLAAIPALALLFARLSQMPGLRPLTGYLLGLLVYWALLALALRRWGGWSLRLRAPSAPVLLALLGLVLVAGLWRGAGLTQLSPHVLAAVIAAAVVNGTLEEAFWRGALIPAPDGRAQVIAAGLFVLWHLAPMAGLRLSGQDGVMLIAGAALIAPFMMAARLSSGTAGMGALCHAALNLFVFAGLAARNGQPL